ncbi:hypothetical protein [Aliterella atlantica]|uniref:Phytase-like domain-containing protein n=1 Tax=Aliterella atlantica CENA595 TaxID=1618023 RepID=A0A0D9A0Z4_9CYAN|nr:hypothetical protein [Aliterella atlantica]KJH73161.1 hypothetical protein UH38_03675 [Aliterella atlantica CENA595]
MHIRLKRRRFGQLALASAATSVLANLSTKTVAQSQLNIYGLRLTPASSSITADLADATSANTTPGIILQSVNLVSNQELSTTEISGQTVQNQQDATETASQAFVISKPSERVTGFTALSDGTFIAAVSAATKKGEFSRFIFFSEDTKNYRPKGLKAKKIKKHNTVESLLAIQNDQLISVVSLNQGQPPFELAVINLKSGQVDSGAALALPNVPLNHRFSNLAQSTDGTIYATTMDAEGVPILVNLDLQNRSPLTGRGKINKLVRLSFNNTSLKSDVMSLAFSPSNQLFALANPQYESTNSLFTVDLQTGELKFIRKFAVDKIAFKKA